MGQWFEEFGLDLWLLGARHADDAAQAALIRRVLRLRRSHRVLDAPCGRGRITIPLARHCVVTGIDLQPSYVRAARIAARKAGVDASFRCADLRSLDDARAYHAVVNWFGSFGYFDDAGNRDLMHRFARALRSGGRLLVEGVHREWILRHFAARRSEPGVGIVNHWDARRQRIEGRWTVGDGPGRGRYRTSIRAYTPAQLRRLFEGAGLAVEACYDHDGSPFTRRSRRLLMVGRKH